MACCPLLVMPPVQTLVQPLMCKARETISMPHSRQNVTSVGEGTWIDASYIHAEAILLLSVMRAVFLDCSWCYTMH